MKSSKRSQIYHQIKDYYPLDYGNNQLPGFLQAFLGILKTKITRSDDSRIGSIAPQEEYADLITKYSKLPDEVGDPLAVSTEIVSDLFDGVPRWRSPNLQHNVGSPVHTAASAMYAMALDENIFSIDDGLAGNALVAEKAVVQILSDLAGLPRPAAGFFVFGGTATNFYAIKTGLQKALPEAAVHGIKKNVKLFVTEDSHFTHRLSADWLGIGTDNVITIQPNRDRTSDIQDAETKLRASLEAGDIIAGIMLNGGTTYNQTVDDIVDFVHLRDRLVDEYKLSYKPHIHVDTVIGWGWLFFREYDFTNNPLQISEQALGMIKEQLSLVSGIKLADSWGADFHKGIGGCPVDCSVIMFNNQEDVFAISKSNNSQLATHQLATEFTQFAPSDFTFETSRAAGTGLAALAVLRSLGVTGYQHNLANLIEATCVFRNTIKNRTDITVANNYSLGYSTMVRIYPPEYEPAYAAKEFDSFAAGDKSSIIEVNEYIKAFYKWDYKTRIASNNGSSGSCSSSFFEYNGVKVSALKFYPTSPHFSDQYAEITAKTLISQKALFDKDVWPSHKAGAV